MMNLLNLIYNELYLRIFPNYQKELERGVISCKSLLDVGCGSSSPIKSFSKNLYCVGVDAFKLSINKSKKERIHNKYYQIDVLDIDKKFEAKSFDCVLASDLIEHLTKDEGYKLINKMERLANKKVIIFTPNGFLPQGEYDNNPWQLHKSGWTVEEFKKLGYKVIGINGWKPLRGEYASIKFWPKIFWLIISDITQLFVRENPKKAFQILCIKDEI